jgi:hypothetical protein|tara:strand:+ start:55 stop:351 length:297 start_codon:yes stop_codon:yes gene_type:complete
MSKKTIEFLNETKKNLKELELEKENVLQLQEELEDTHDIEDDDERIDEQARLEREYSDKVDYVDYLEKQIKENFTIDVAKKLVPVAIKLITIHTASSQ